MTMGPAGVDEEADRGAEAMKRKPTERRGEHLDRGEPVFIPPERMSAIRREEAVARSQARREGNDDPCVLHGTCHCGSIECVGVPRVTNTPKRKKRRGG
jgi:hypothetical protein